MSVIPVDLPAARTAVDRVSGQVEDLLRSIPDTSGQVPGLEWTAGETGAHLVTAIRWFDDYAAGREKPPVTTGEIASFNAERIAGYLERDGSQLASHLHEAVQNFLTTTSGRNPNEPFPWYDDYPIDVGDGTAVLLGELVVHGRDLAQAVGRAWPITADDARTILAGAFSLLPLYVNPDKSRGFSATYEIRVRGNPPVYMSFADGLASVGTERPERVDCRITADPVDYLLLGYGRIGQLRPILTGKLIAWGRKPWLGSKLDTLFRDP